MQTQAGAANTAEWLREELKQGDWHNERRSDPPLESRHDLVVLSFSHLELRALVDFLNESDTVSIDSALDDAIAILVGAAATL